MNPIRLKRPGRPEPLNETAATWVLTAEGGRMSNADQDRLRDWLEDPVHLGAFNDALWALDAVQRHSGSPELMAMREAALGKRAEPNHRRARPIASLGTAAVAATIAGLLWIGQPSLPYVGHRTASDVVPTSTSHTTAEDGLYRTGIGERSAVVLPDGSVATLDTDSQLRIAYTGAARGVYLVKGQALFEVAKGNRRPFQVYAADQRITAVGTTFNVRIEGRQVQVSMAEGVVKVRPIQANSELGRPAQVLTLRAGQALTTAPSGTALVRPVDSSQVATWRGGLLVFEDAKLSDAVAEINRYTDRPIKLADASIGQYRVTGVFKTSDPGHFATAMSEVFPIEVRRDAAGSPVLKALH